MLSKLSMVRMVDSIERRTSTWREMDISGGMIAHECGGSVRPGFSVYA